MRTQQWKYQVTGGENPTARGAEKNKKNRERQKKKQIIGAPSLRRRNEPMSKQNRK